MPDNNDTPQAGRWRFRWAPWCFCLPSYWKPGAWCWRARYWRRAKAEGIVKRHNVFAAEMGDRPAAACLHIAEVERIWRETPDA